MDPFHKAPWDPHKSQFCCESLIRFSPWAPGPLTRHSICRRRLHTCESFALSLGPRPRTSLLCSIGRLPSRNQASRQNGHALLQGPGDRRCASRHCLPMTWPQHRRRPDVSATKSTRTAHSPRRCSRAASCGGGSMYGSRQMLHSRSVGARCDKGSGVVNRAPSMAEGACLEDSKLECGSRHCKTAVRKESTFNIHSHLRRPRLLWISTSPEGHLSTRLVAWLQTCS